LCRCFARKKEADAYHARVRVEVREGRHTPDSESITIAEAGRHWIKAAEGNALDRTMVEGYQYLLDAHIVPFLGNMPM
jgi:integrase